MRGCARLLRGVLQRVVAVCTVRLVNVVPRADHAHDTRRLRVLTLQQGRRCCLVQGVLLQMVVTRGAATRRDQDIFSLVYRIASIET